MKWSQIDRPTTMLEMVKAFRGLMAIHSAFGGAARELEVSRAVPLCIEHCGWCCERSTPVVWAIEAHNIVSCALGNGHLSEIRSRCEGWLLDSVPGVKIYGLPSGRVQDIEALRPEIEIVQRTACPFLDGDKRCIIHKDKPILCMAYGVTRVPGRQCRRPMGMGESESVRAFFGGQGAVTIKDGIGKYLSGLRPEWTPSWFLPTILFMLTDEKKYKAIVDDGKVASAKLIVGRASPNIIFQEQLQVLWDTAKRED